MRSCGRRRGGSEGGAECEGEGEDQEERQRGEREREREREGGRERERVVPFFFGFFLVCFGGVWRFGGSGVDVETEDSKAH